MLHGMVWYGMVWYGMEAQQTWSPLLFSDLCFVVFCFSCAPSTGHNRLIQENVLLPTATFTEHLAQESETTPSDLQPKSDALRIIYKRICEHEGNNDSTQIHNHLSAPLHGKGYLSYNLHFLMLACEQATKQNSHRR